MKRAAFACALAVSVAMVPAIGESADIYVPSGGNLQAALNAARAGDTILLEPGGTYVGNFTLPVHGGTTHVTIRSAAPDSVLPPAGKRMAPSYAAHLPKLESPNSAPALRTAPGAAYWRLQFLEFKANYRGYNDIITFGDGSSDQYSMSQVPHHLIVDRVYMHGDVLDGQKRGIALNSGDTTVINSYIAEIKAIGQDSQALGGWNGPGPYHIENNYLEAAGEVVLFGGGDPAIPNLVPSDIVVTRNTMRRPVSWRDPIVPAPSNVTASASGGGSLPAGTYGYKVVARRPAYTTTASSPASAQAVAATGAGGRVTISWDPVPHATSYLVYGRTAGGQNVYWTVDGSTTSFADSGSIAGKSGTPSSRGTVWLVKNLFELKNARRVKVDRNVIENNWAQGQSGIAIVFTPRNQNGKCLWCVVEDVTFEHNIVRGIGGGITILGYDNINPSQQTNNIRVRHNLFTDLSKSWGGHAYFLTIVGEPRDVTIDHNTIISPDGAGVISAGGTPIPGFVFTNNVARHNRYGIFGNNYAIGMSSITRYFPDGVIARNVLAGGKASLYPVDNQFPTTEDFEAHFTDYAGGDFSLKRGTDWERAGTDGLDLGANLADGDVTPHAPSRPLAPTSLRFEP